MKTAFGKLVMLTMVVALGMLLLAPMRSGIEDSLMVSIQSVSLESGQTITVPYKLTAENIQTVTYSSDNALVATVNQQGVITAVSPGSTIIRLTAQGGAEAEIEVQVAGVPISSFSVNTKQLDMNKGDVSGLSYAFNYGATPQHVVWSSSDPDVVKVDSAGRLTAINAGEAWVTATTVGGMSDSALIRVSVRNMAVQIIPEAMTVGVGAVFSLETRNLPEDATDDVVLWSSSAPRVLAVTEDGVARAISSGTAKVMATTRSGLTATAVIDVEPASKDFLLNPVELTIERGEVYPIEACFIGADGQVDENVNHHIQWTSSAPSVASVKNGVVTALKSGRTTITAKADGFEASCDVTVQTSVKEVHLNITEQNIYQNQMMEPFQLRGTVLPVDADNAALTYVSDNELVASVSPRGLVTLTGGCGTAVITVESENGISVSCTVNVIAVDSH